MDPQATWDQLQEALRIGDREAVCELAQALLDWLGCGGFPPGTAAGRPDEIARQRAAVTRFCRLALQPAAES